MVNGDRYILVMHTYMYTQYRVAIFSSQHSVGITQIVCLWSVNLVRLSVDKFAKLR